MTLDDTDGAGLASRRIGEVVEASSTSFSAQCFKLYEAPPLGSLVRAGAPPIFAVTSGVNTQPLDPTRPVLARGESAESEEQVFHDNPQLARLFTTRFEALIAGHTRHGDCRQYLPPLPPPVHSFVYTCSADEVTHFTSRLDFLPLLLSSGLPAADEVAGACLRQAAAARADGPAFLSWAGRTLAAQLSNDLPRLNTVLRKIAA